MSYRPTPPPEAAAVFLGGAVQTFLIPQPLDITADLVDCMHSIKMPELNDLLDQAMEKYENGDVMGFAMDISDATDLYVQAIHPSCDNTPTVINGLAKVAEIGNAFLAQADPEQAALDNYNANIALITAYGSIMTPAWNNQLYHQAGQFFGFMASDVIIAPDIPDTLGGLIVAKLLALQ